MQVKNFRAEKFGSKIYKQNLELFKQVEALEVIKDFIHLSHRVQLNAQPEIVQVVNVFEALVEQVKQQKYYGDAVNVLNSNTKIVSDALTVAKYSMIGKIVPVKKVIGEKIHMFEQQKELHRLPNPEPQLFDAIFKYLEEKGLISVPYNPLTNALYHERVDTSKIAKHQKHVADSRNPVNNSPFNAKL